MGTDLTPSLWESTFNKLLEEELEYNDTWVFRFNNSLHEQLSPEEKRRGWKIYCPSAFGQFKCKTCSKTWPSARVMVLFHYRLQKERGTVVMRRFGQKCRRCNGDFARPGFSPRVVEEVLLKLISKIRKNCYGEEDEGGGCSSESTVVWTKPHESSLCEACAKGICSKVDQDRSA
ncbi:hypothetical protein AGOR_G00037150 [Albula goreensis]|uniref:3CxxC-type domain-containing protein n=1 Tax=Albula goreensis TaxID=1534307 RepID=A0A8T3E0D1_9TELE|nr:hypothetical protein AGOR_G00037150 [Albula goreensis]